MTASGRSLSEAGDPRKSGQITRYFPSSIMRQRTPCRAAARCNGTESAKYSPSIPVAYLLFHSKREVDRLAIGFEWRNHEPRQTPTAQECSSGYGTRTDACAAWRWRRPAPGRVGSPPRPSCSTGTVRGTDEGTPHDALLSLQEDAL